MRWSRGEGLLLVMEGVGVRSAGLETVDNGVCGERCRRSPGEYGVREINLGILIQPCRSWRVASEILSLGQSCKSLFLLQNFARLDTTAQELGVNGLWAVSGNEQIIEGNALGDP